MLDQATFAVSRRLQPHATPQLLRLLCLPGLLWAMAIAAAQPVSPVSPISAVQCRQQFANNPAAQLECARNAYAESVAPAAPVEPQPASLLAAPLVNLQTIFGFYDRRFPGFNNGQDHLGVDFSAAAGAPVTAICNGKVVFNNTTQATIGAAVVMVEHDCPQPLGLVYGYYGHVQSILLTGENVTVGGNIGYVRDWGGNSHLHLGLSTRLVETDWGVVRGASLQELEAQGWLNPLNFFNGVEPRPAAVSVPQPVARPKPPARTFVPLKPYRKPATSAVKRQHVR